MEDGNLRRKSVADFGYLPSTTTHWRMRAEAIRTIAKDANDPAVRAMMLRIAAGYDRLAANADDRAPQNSIMFRPMEVLPLGPSGSRQIRSCDWRTGGK
jgi:hypothetical protein